MKRLKERKFRVNGPHELGVYDWATLYITVLDVCILLLSVFVRHVTICI